MQQTKTREIGLISNPNGGQVLRMWNVCVPAGKRPFQHHRHLNFEIMRVDSGSGVYTTEKREYPICPGDIFVFSCNEVHSITSIGSEGLQITNLHIHPHFLCSSVTDRRSKINISFCFSHHPDFSNRIPAADAKKLSSLFLQMRSELPYSDSETSLSVTALLQLFLVSLVRSHGYPEETSDSGAEQLHSLRHILDYIDEHFSEKITLQELSALAGLTPPYFSAFFKQAIGISLWNYISSRRIDKAIHLITSGDRKQNMLDIAADCGFNNSANFNKTFKKFTGVTPREYKNNMGREIS